MVGTLYCYNLDMDVQEFMDSYSFELDPFQIEAIDHLSSGSSTLVSAPTGSGKTVIAEYALELARQANKKIFYTTPLKALSNQKFRDFSGIYPAGQVGLLTGDPFPHVFDNPPAFTDSAGGKHPPALNRRTPDYVGNSI